MLDHRELAVMNGLGYARALWNLLSGRLVWGLLRSGARSAAVFATGGHFLGAALMARRQRAMPWRADRYRLFSPLTPLSEIVAGLNEYQPGLLNAYPSALQLLAEEQAAGRLHIRPSFLASAGETLTPVARQDIEAALGCPVVDLYNASEINGSTFVCRRGAMHVSADWFILEPVDEQHRAVPPGEPSYSLLVTNLANYVQPIIRYELDSLTLLPGLCSCGSIMPAFRVEGRTDEIDLRGARRIACEAASACTRNRGGRNAGDATPPAHPDRATNADDAPGGTSRCGRDPRLVDSRRAPRQISGGAGRQASHYYASPGGAGPNARGGKLRHVWSEMSSTCSGAAA